MILETVYSSQTKLIGQSLSIGEHRIGYLNLAFEAKKGQKRLIFGFKPLIPRRTINSELEHIYKRVHNKESFENR